MKLSTSYKIAAISLIVTLVTVGGTGIPLLGIDNSGGSLYAQDTEKAYYVQTDTLVVAKVNGTNQFLAYSKMVGKWRPFTFPEGVTAVPVVGKDVCAFQLQGEAITEILAVDIRGNWCKSKLPAATQNCTPIVDDDLAVYVVDGKVHAFSGRLGEWDSVVASVTPQLSDDTAMIVAPDSIAVFSAATGKWAVAQTTPQTEKRGKPSRVQLDYLEDSDVVVIRGEKGDVERTTALFEGEMIRSQPERSGLEIKIFSIAHGNAQDLARALKDLFPVDGTSPIYVAYDLRTNSVMVRGTPTELAEAEAILLKLDHE